MSMTGKILQSSWNPMPVQPFSPCDLTFPFVIEDAVKQWPAMAWTMDTLSEILSDSIFRCRLMPQCREKKGNPAWESESLYINCKLQHFNAWCQGKALDNNPFAPFSPLDFSAYIDYKYLTEVFAECPQMLQDVQWRTLGLKGVDGQHSTMWIGSPGASTPCHYDTYGFNLVAQIQGRKQWVLFPPEESGSMYPTRIPYEESSVFSQVDLAHPDLRRFPHFKKTHPIVITLEPGQVLYVPRQWWHYVTCIQTAISINTWVEVPEDSASRLHEAVTRVLASSLIPYMAHSTNHNAEDDWINPTEELESALSNVNYLRKALMLAQKQSCMSETATTIQPQHPPFPSCPASASAGSPHCLEKDSGILPTTDSENDELDEDGSSSFRVIKQHYHEGNTGTWMETSGIGITFAELEAAAEKVKSDSLGSEKQQAQLTADSSIASKPATEKQRKLQKSLEQQMQTPKGSTGEVTSGKKQHSYQGSASDDRHNADHFSTDDRRVADHFSTLNRSIRLLQLARALENSHRQFVDSPFCLSEHYKNNSNTQDVQELCKRPTDIKRSLTDVVSKKRKTCVAKEDLLDNEADLDTSLERPKKACQSEKTEFTQVHFSSESSRNTEADDEAFENIFQVNTGSEDLTMSIYIPRPCHLKQYLDLLQQKLDETLDACLEQSESCSSRQESLIMREAEKQGELEEALLQSVLHPDVIKLIVEKLQEQK